MASAASARIRIRTAALELFGRKGVAGTTVQDLSRRSRCSQAVLYKYWASKEGLAEELFQESYGRLIDWVREGMERWREPSERVIGGLLGFLRFARMHPHEHAMLFQVFHSDYARWLTGRPKPRDLLVEEISSGMKSGALPEGDPGLKAAMLLGMTIRIALFERQNLIGENAEQVDEELALAAAAVLGV